MRGICFCMRGMMVSRRRRRRRRRDAGRCVVQYLIFLFLYFFSLFLYFCISVFLFSVLPLAPGDQISRHATHRNGIWTGPGTRHRVHTHSHTGRQRGVGWLVGWSSFLGYPLLDVCEREMHAPLGLFWIHTPLFGGWVCCIRYTLTWIWSCEYLGMERAKCYTRVFVLVPCVYEMVTVNRDNRTKKKRRRKKKH